MVTPRGVLTTRPRMRSACAVRRTQGRKPTPWTAPSTSMRRPSYIMRRPTLVPVAALVLSVAQERPRFVHEEGQGCLQVAHRRGRQVVPELEAVPPNGERPSRWRFPDDGPMHIEHGGRRHGVTAEARVTGWLHARILVRSLHPHAGIDEHHAPPPDEIERVLDLQLKVGETFHLPAVDLGAQRLFRAVDEERPQGIVSARRVSDTEDEQRRRHSRSPFLTSRSTRAPVASTISTTSGIFPRAWVAQDRQGSNARMATSM